MSNPQSIARNLSTSFANAGITALTLIWLAACGGVSDKTPNNDFVPEVVEWNLIFEDNFDGTELDASVWNIDEGDGCPDLCGWGNNELQVYSADNIEVSGGTLKLTGQEEIGGGYTSARINTQGKFDFTYGKVEVRARIPAGQGTWPAIWALHSPAGGLNPNPDYQDVGVYGPWPASGELDIMEAFNYGSDAGDRMDKIRSTTHYGLDIEPFEGTGSFSEKMGMSLTPNADMQFYVYGMEWENGRVRYYVDMESLVDRDGQVDSTGHFQTITIDEYYAYFPAGPEGFYDPIGSNRSPLNNAPFDQPFHLLLNFAIGGDPVGDPDPATIFPQSLEIDYVRVYECANSNPDTRRGCGSVDPSVTPLEDLDGTPLEDVTTANPYIETLDLFLDAPELVTVNFATDVATNQIEAAVGFAAPGALVVSNTEAADPDDPANTVWRVAVSGDTANVLLTGEDKSGDPVLGTGFDFSSDATNDGDPAPVGELVFDMYVTAIDPTTNLFIKLDSGFPDLGEVLLDQADLSLGAWKTYSIKFRDLLANPGFVECCGGEGVDLENVLNPFVFEVQSGAADVFLDNIRVTNACYVVGGCSAGPIVLGLPDVIIFDDAVNTASWDLGINGASTEDGFASNYTDGTADRKAQWAIIDDPDDVAARGQILNITYRDDTEFGIMFIGGSSGVDLSAYSAGGVEFDIFVEDYGNAPGMTFKVDGADSSSGDKNIGRVGDGAWETVQVPASLLTSSGLELSEVTAAVFFPSTPQTGGISFRIDNMRWIDEAEAPPLAQIDLPVTFDDPTVDYSLIDFEGTGTSLVADPDNASNTVASTTKGPGGMDFAGTVIGTSAGFANPIPFAPGATTLSMRVRAPAPGIAVTLQVENAANDDAVRRQVAAFTMQTDEWETLTFDFSTVGIDTSVEFVRAVLFFDLGTVGGGETYLWEDLAFGAGGPVIPEQIDLPVTFDDPAVDYTLIDFGGTSTSIVTDPAGGPNQVAQTVHNGGPFAGTVIGNDSFASPIPFSATETTLSLRVWSPSAGIPVMLKVEDSTDGGINAEVIATTTVAGAWETLVYDYAGSIDPVNTYDKAALFFNFPNAGDGATYHWDDLAFGIPLLQIDLPVTFDDPAVDYTLIDFGGTSTSVVIDPAGGPNQVAQTVHNGGPFAGTVIGNDSFASPIPFTATETTLSLRVWSPSAGIPVMLKVENSADGGINAEVIATTTVAGDWETLVYDYAGSIDPVNTYDKAALFFNFPNAGDGATYNWDDLEFTP